jgi:hypothetical protein
MIRRHQEPWTGRARLYSGIVMSGGMSGAVT